jgi:hypothetical protein
MEALISSNIDPQHVSSYNNHGKTLVELLGTTKISSLHHPLILGLFAVYTTLVSLHYVNSDDVSWAPHSNLIAEQWLAIGFTEEVVDILALLPYPRKKVEGWDLAPEAPALSYLGTGNIGVRDTTFNQDDNILPDHIRLTNGGRDGNNYIYNTKEGKSLFQIKCQYVFMIIGTMCIENMYFYMPGTSYTSLTFYPSKLIMKNWVQNLYDLVYLPWPFDGYGDGARIFVQPGPKEFEADTGNRNDIAFSTLHDWANEQGWNSGLSYREEKRRTDLNFIRAIRNIYREQGWPDRFEGTALHTTLEAFNMKKDQHDDRVHKANPMAYDTLGSEAHPDEIEPRNQREEFLLEAAGQMAIGRA